MITINYIAFQKHLRIKNEGDKRFIFDSIRKKWLVLFPEELVRQLVVLYLINEKKYPPGRIAIERGITVNGLQKRPDILIYDKERKPYLLVECKAPTVKLNDRTFEQIATYNLSFKVPYLMVTNGVDTYCCSMDYNKKEFLFLDKIPQS